MKEKKVRRFAPHHKTRRLEGPAGQVTLQGELLEVDFVFSPAKVQAIKEIPHARFQKETKRWTIPLRYYDLLARSEHFGRDRLDYRFEPEVILEGVQRSSEAVAAAIERWKQNPFAVSKEDIDLVEPDIVFFLNDKGNLRALPRFRSKAQKLLEKNKAAHYLKSERAYFFPTQDLPRFLKSLRDLNATFAVEKTAGERLRATAEIRSRLNEFPESAEESELREALLGPYLHAWTTDDGQVVFALKNWTSQQLRLCFPKIKTHGEKRALAEGFLEDAVIELLRREIALPFQIWKTKDAEWHLRHLKSRLETQSSIARNLSEAVARIISLPAVWVSDHNGVAGLMIAPKEYERLFRGKNHPLSRIRKELLTGPEERHFFQPRASELPVLIQAVDDYLERSGEAVFARTTELEQFLMAVSQQSKLREQCRSFQDLGDTPLADDLFSVPELSKKLFPHQRTAVSWLCQTPHAFLGDDMGLGKTLSVLAAFDALKNRDECDFLLVVCPNSLVRNWVRETASWLPSRKLYPLPPDKKGKLSFFKKISWGGITLDAMVLNYEAVRLPYVLPAIESLLSGKKVFLCLDESQRVKNPASKTFQALRTLSPLCRRRVLLSGTPTPKDVSDIWAQMFLIDEGERFGSNYYEWLGRIAELGNRYSEYAVKRFRPDEVKEVILRVQEVLLRRRKEEVVQLPEKTFIVRDVELHGDQLKRYDEVRGDLLLRMTSLSGKEFVRQIDNILEEYLRAVQVGSNPRLIDENWKGTPAKFEELDELIQEIVVEQGEKIVVWTNFLGNIRELTARYAKLGAAQISGEVSTAVRDRTVHEFQNGREIKVLVAVPAAGGVGLTLTAAQTAVYLDKTWNAEHWMQSVDRLHRIGQRGTVRIISLQSTPVDELIARNIARKARIQAELLGDAEVDETALSYPSIEELIAAVREKQSSG